ncbi:MAG: PAS domain S-box protein, partial [Bacteroides sp.]|nr:PAS domain S-box protein [Bacteroides sp.]
NPVDKVLRKGTIVGLANHTILIAKDGNEIPIDDSAAPIRDEKGNVSGIVLIFRDISERKQSEKGLQQIECIVSTSSDMMALLNKDFVYLSANDAYVGAFGKTKDEVIGHSVSDIFGDEFFEKIIKPNAEHCLSGHEVHYNDWFEFSVGGRQYMDVVYLPYLGDNKKIEGFVVNARNITELK